MMREASMRFEAGAWQLHCGATRLVLSDGVGLRYLSTQQRPCGRLPTPNPSRKREGDD